MTKRVLINGFGRMGRLFFRAAFDRSEFEIIAINELKGGPKTAAHLLEFDSIHGTWKRDIKFNDTEILVDGKSIKFSNAKSPIDIDVKDIDIVVECSGVFKDEESLKPYYDNGVNTVLVSAPVKGRALNVVYGINDNLYNPTEHNLVTSASCTTNCLAPVVKVINEKLGIKHGSMTTIHDITNTQTIIDAPHKDLRRARACSQSLIPTTTGSATAITMIYPELKGKLNGLAVRVPLLNASLTDCVFEVNRETSKEEVNSLLKEASESYLEGILGYEERPLVSVDYKDDIRSSIIDGLSTIVINKTQVKILAWYDNEIGYVNRMADFCSKIARSI
ncbi:ArsJ-associated glyceraldehyde-3-phosphate dehydrogenase [Thiospirochaeta perfilievii]|uniref:Glyceraldehyde-3-phosphate dehydrogenase n=1 Tax=Thiospirochaeta perfilievii TaxID=252967 RepID=A0A5C1QB85_9SPIO|nr:ArsJ-associated glyceraldehyde-3-phosphate dehydrogenase [Thiospirochaeta perfilievii]QEN03422.1 ArsJ-associated glyceraldehyde-3-phosphate dehydrogenase [Thiospirochaeta perfilievii]